MQAAGAASHLLTALVVEHMRSAIVGCLAGYSAGGGSEITKLILALDYSVGPITDLLLLQKVFMGRLSQGGQQPTPTTAGRGRTVAIFSTG